jgi:transposase, IS605 orfB family
MTIIQQVEKHVIKKSHPYYNMFCEYTHLAKNLYNHANYLVRNEFVETGKWLRYLDLDKILREDLEFPDYRNMPAAQSAQQVLRLLDRNWKSFFNSIKDWSKNKERYLGRPKLPKYKPKDGKLVLPLTNQQVKVKGDLLHFPKSFCGFTVKPRCITLDNFEKINQVRIVPKGQFFCLEIVYSISVESDLLSDNGRYMSIDLGLDNLVTVVTNTGLNPIIVNGKGLKSNNQYYNKKKAHYQSVAKQMNKQHYTNRLYRLTQKRNLKVEDYLHKASRYIVDFALENQINTIVIGNNKNWKQSISLGKKTNQSFVQLPHQKLIDKICYKAELFGIQVILTEESYTSGTSFLDDEPPQKEFYNKKRRVRRGLFVSNKGIKINADVNAAFQIMKKVFPNVFTEGIEGVVLHPVRVGIV